MDFKSIAKKVGSYAPLIGTALGGSAGNLVGQFIAHQLGTTVDHIEETINNDPEAAKQKLLAMEQEHAETLAILVDKASARQMQIATTQVTGKRDWTPTALSIAFLIIYAIIQFYVIKNPNQQLDIISARVQDVLILIMSFWFGSSHKQSRENNS